MPAGTNTIGDYAFFQSKALTGITFPAGLTRIGEWSFSECQSLKSVRVPDSVTFMGRGVFRDCRQLVTAVVGSGVRNVSHTVFAECTALAEVTMRGSMPPAGGRDMFLNCPTSLVIRVPAATIGAWRGAEWWSVVASRMRGI